MISTVGRQTLRFCKYVVVNIWTFQDDSNFSGLLTTLMKYAPTNLEKVWRSQGRTSEKSLSMSPNVLGLAIPAINVDTENTAEYSLPPESQCCFPVLKTMKFAHLHADGGIWLFPKSHCSTSGHRDVPRAELYISKTGKGTLDVFLSHDPTTTKLGVRSLIQITLSLKITKGPILKFGIKNGISISKLLQTLSVQNNNTSSCFVVFILNQQKLSFKDSTHMLFIV